jgi:dTDP-4-dehydrorhamnose 3,5-epimerase
MNAPVSEKRPLDARKDAQSMTPGWEPVDVPITGVKIVPSRHVATRNGLTTECFRSDWPATGYDVGHAIINRWDRPIITDWHCHRTQIDHAAVIQGRVVIGLYDDRRTSPSFGKVMTVRCDWASPQMVTIPPGVFHAFKVIVAPALMLNCITIPYQYADPDDWRILRQEAHRIPLDLAAME